MKILKIALLILLTSGIQAKSNKWQPLKYIDDYPASAFNLKKGVAYLEIRQYEIDGNNKLRKKPYKIVHAFYRTTLKSFNPKIVKKFRKLTPNLSTKSDILIYSEESSGIGCYYRYNAFMIDDQGKMWRMHMMEDIIGFLGEIDTPAEVEAVLWLHNKSGNRYRKTSKGYDIIIEFDDQLNYCKSFKYRASINKKGKIVKYKLLKSKKLEEGCISVPVDTPCRE